MMNIKRLLISTALLSMSVSGVAFADWAAKFDAPSGPNATMRIDLPDDLDVMTLTTLGVELDGTDITAMLGLDGADFVYTPIQPLSAGEHVVVNPHFLIQL